MKQEQRLVAETYRFLAPFIDTAQDVYLSLDGQAAQTGVGLGHFVDATIPDLWFSIIGCKQAMLIEAKALGKNNQVLLMQSQLKAWRTNGTGSHKPEFWIAVSNSFDAFFLWRHSDFVAAMDKSKNKQKTVTIAAPTKRQEFKTVSQLALAILCYAQQGAPADVSVGAPRRQSRV